MKSDKQNRPEVRAILIPLQEAGLNMLLSYR